MRLRRVLQRVALAEYLTGRKVGADVIRTVHGIGYAGADGGEG